MFELELDQGGPWVPPPAGTPTLDDLRFDQDTQDLTCVGCGLTRQVGGSFWRWPLLLTPEMVERCRLPVSDDVPSHVCPDCEPWVISGIRVIDT